MSWYAQSMTELRALLDQIGEEGSVVLESDSPATAAIIAMLEGGFYVYAAGKAVEASIGWLSKLEN